MLLIAFFAIAQFPDTFPGSVRLRAFDLSGRTVWTTQTITMQNEMQLFTLNSVQPGILIFTAENEGSTVSARVVVLKP